eukprot:1549258-Alexandrium_andersonii.AAC.1
MASGVRTWKCAGPRTASKLVPEDPEGCALRSFARRFRICPRKLRSRGPRSRNRNVTNYNPQSANPQSAQSLAIGAREANSAYRPPRGAPASKTGGR